MAKNEYLKNNKTEPWNIDDLDKVLKRLKNNISMDPNGMVNELFKEGCIGRDLKEALTRLLNGVKTNQLIPMFMNLSNITTIYKNKGSRFELNNDRGIFILTVLKKILDNLMMTIILKLMKTCPTAMLDLEGKGTLKTIY